MKRKHSQKCTEINVDLENLFYRFLNCPTNVRIFQTIRFRKSTSPTFLFHSIFICNQSIWFHCTLWFHVINDHKTVEDKKSQRQILKNHFFRGQLNDTIASHFQRKHHCRGIALLSMSFTIHSTSQLMTVLPQARYRSRIALLA